MRLSAVSRRRCLALGFLALGALLPVGCGTILGLDTPTLVDAGTAASIDVTTGEGGGAGDGGVDSTVDVAEANTEDVVEDGNDGGEETDAVAEAGNAEAEAGSFCEGGLTECVPAEGGAPTCADLTSDPANCNACGAACPVNHNTPTCTGGVCGLGTCAANYLDCDNNPSNGCEVNLETDPLNCGKCGNACTGGQVCVNGNCGLNCPGSEVVCRIGPDGGVSDAGTGPGYCTNLSGDPNNCGGCGAACPINNNTPTCSGGSCATGTCAQGYGDCNGNPADGCEVNLETDPAHCGTCANACSVANATTGCTGGQCIITSCTTGFGDCDMSYGDGCEANLTDDPLNCGACGNNCGTACTGNVGGTTCTNSACAITSCSPGYYNLDDLCGNGCECKATTVQACATPSIITLNGPGSSSTETGNLVSGTDAWYQVTFSSNKATTYHPHVVLTTNPGNEYEFDIETNCTGGNAACGEKLDAGPEAGAFTRSTGLSNWEVFYQPGVDFVDANFQPIPLVNASGTVFIHVYRASGAPEDCNTYTLTVSN
jgi:hypothetical protein